MVQVGAHLGQQLGLLVAASGTQDERQPVPFRPDGGRQRMQRPPSRAATSLGWPGMRLNPPPRLCSHTPVRPAERPEPMP